MIWFHLIFLFISLNTPYFPQSFIQLNYTAHYFLNRACIFLLFLKTEFSPEAFIEDLDCDSFCARKQNRLEFIFCFVKSSQSLMGEQTHRNYFNKIWDIHRNEFKIAKRYLAIIHMHFHLWISSANFKIQDQWYHFSEGLCSFPDHSQVLSPSQSDITCWLHFSSVLITHCLCYSVWWTDEILPAML